MGSAVGTGLRQLRNIRHHTNLSLFCVVLGVNLGFERKVVFEIAASGENLSVAARSVCECSRCWESLSLLLPAR